jgi:hypothetical protein
MNINILTIGPASCLRTEFREGPSLRVSSLRIRSSSGTEKESLNVHLENFVDGSQANQYGWLVGFACIYTQLCINSERIQENPENHTMRMVAKNRFLSAARSWSDIHVRHRIKQDLNFEESQETHVTDFHHWKYPDSQQ